MKRITIFLLTGMFAKVSFATTPRPLVAIYGVFKEVGVPGNPTVAGES